MLTNRHPSLAHSFRHLLSHVSISLLAVGIAFSLPFVAEHILYSGWPKAESNARLLMGSEVAFAALLVLLFNISKIVWDSRRGLKFNAQTALAHPGEGNDWLTRQRDREVRKHVQGTREVSILSLTGREVLDTDSWVGSVLNECNEVRVLLMHPAGSGVYERTRLSANPEAARKAYRQEVEATIHYLTKLVAEGKRVRLRFYDAVPFWRLVVAGDYVQVQYCYSADASKWPEYMFELRKDQPGKGLFTPFYVNFLTQWQNQQLPEYDFETQQLIYSNTQGEIKRETIPRKPSHQQLAAASLQSLISNLHEAKKHVDREAA
ncbi:hypothetical protein [Sulfuriferula thiophila]|uniref:hypothetical protein n=1 Tax=Sulfuriferula thiophila TaxID=1781211 RepID=UPI000F61280F|nr:hypothetical protein [Sulfuriferula thiophila]